MDFVFSMNIKKFIVNVSKNSIKKKIFYSNFSLINFFQLNYLKKN